MLFSLNPPVSPIAFEPMPGGPAFGSRFTSHDLHKHWVHSTKSTEPGVVPWKLFQHATVLRESVVLGWWMFITGAYAACWAGNDVIWLVVLHSFLFSPVFGIVGSLTKMFEMGCNYQPEIYNLSKRSVSGIEPSCPWKGLDQLARPCSAYPRSTTMPWSIPVSRDTIHTLDSRSVGTW